jgi:SAM-dependent methyltransferase
MHPNYQFLLDFLRANTPAGGRALDYGCGAGEVVEAARAAGIDACGVEVFYAGGSYRAAADEKGLLGGVIRELRDGRIDFPDATFDVVVNNQVFEHVDDLDAVLAEIRRVLKPGGKVLSLFPHREVWWEGHCAIPFLHRFPSGSKLRLVWAALLRTAGMGVHTAGKGRWQWSADMCDWLDKYTRYRPYRDIEVIFGRHFATTSSLEDAYLEFRMSLHPVLRGWSRFVSRAPRLAQLIVRKKAGLVVVST